MSQAKTVLKPTLAAHLACGHLLGVVKEEKDLIPTLNKECYEVCQKCVTTYILKACHANTASKIFCAAQMSIPVKSLTGVETTFQCEHGSQYNYYIEIGMSLAFLQLSFTESVSECQEGYLGSAMMSGVKQSNEWCALLTLLCLTSLNSAPLSQQVLNQVQLNNLLALAPIGSAAAFELCRSVATTHGTATANTVVAPTGEGTPPNVHHQVSRFA